MTTQLEEIELELRLKEIDRALEYHRVLSLESGLPIDNTLLLKERLLVLGEIMKRK